MMQWLESKVRVHDLCLVGCYFNPLIRKMQFIPGMDKRVFYKEKTG